MSLNSYPSTMPWYRSNIVIPAIISVICKALVLFGVVEMIDADMQQELSDLILLVIGGIADLWAVVSRITQKAAPVITLVRKDS